MPQMSAQWRSLEELAEDPSLHARLMEEFPAFAAQRTAPLDRRSAMKLMAAALAMNGLGGCDLGAPNGELIPAVRAPAEIVPGLPNFYATASLLQGCASGVVVKHHMGRPIKVDGNPRHPASLGATDVFAQAEVLNFYDPDRAFGVSFKGEPTSGAALDASLAQLKQTVAAKHGAGLTILTGAISSPTLATQIRGLIETYPEARWRRFEPISRGNIQRGAVLAYGRALEPLFHLGAADVILAIDSDLLSAAPGHLRYAREFAARRNPTLTPKMSRVYAMEPTPTLIGAAADHRFVAGTLEIPHIVAMLADAVLRNQAVVGAPHWLEPVVADLMASKGRALVHLGPDQPPELQRLVYAMNEALGANGSTMSLIEPVIEDFDADIVELSKEMHEGSVEALLILDCNPVFTAPRRLAFAEALRRVEFSLALTQTPNETSDACLWATPMSHVWESWGDARAFDGTATILQPQALPLYGGMDALQLLGALEPLPKTDSLARVQATWRSHLKGDFESAWRDCLAEGVVPETAALIVAAQLRSQAPSIAPAHSVSALALLTRPDPCLWDGRFAGNPWLQETPRPFTKLTWDNPLLLSPALAGHFDVANGDLVRVSRDGATVDAAIWVMPGQADDCVVALLGGGRARGGPIGASAGFDFYPLTGGKGGVSLTKTGARTSLAATDHHHLLFDEAGVYARHTTLAEFDAKKDFLHGAHSPKDTLYEWKPKGPAAWAMSVDLNACIGCNACVVACQAENNVPTVGKEEVLREREMHWLRIDRYFEGSADRPDIYLQPTLCQHCEQAPCETVCPVGATMHDDEGLNVMVYNRCIGTRFCSNNCPYKVRRFNYFAFAEKESLAPQARNPEVTVRARGVMEKCTFCLQRIAEARIVADRDDEPIADVVTACQAACPTKAFTFGNLANPESEVAKRKRSPLDYSLLADQNTHPRVTYEARIRNKNPAIASEDT